MTGSDDDGRRAIRLMMDYGVTMPLWGDDHFADDEGLGLSEALRSDLEAFAERWEASIPPRAFDDRWDNAPAIRTVVNLCRDIRWFLDRDGRRAAEREDEAIRAEGEDLRRRLQAELGDQFDVTYQP